MSNPWHNMFKALDVDSENTTTEKSGVTQTKDVKPQNKKIEGSKQKGEYNKNQTENTYKNRPQTQQNSKFNKDAQEEITAEGYHVESNEERKGGNFQYRGNRGNRGTFRGGRGDGGYRGNRGGEGGYRVNRGGERGTRGGFRGNRGQYGGGRGYQNRFQQPENTNFEEEANYGYGQSQYEDTNEEYNTGSTVRYPGKQNSSRPYDRHSGTGRGKEMKRQGHGPNNWGNAQDVMNLGINAGEYETQENVDNGEGVEVNVQKYEDSKQEDNNETEEEKKLREEEEEKVRKQREIEEKMLTVDEYLEMKNQKRANLPKKEARKVEEINKKDIKKFERESEKQDAPAKTKNNDEYKMTAQGEHGNLLTFTYEADDFRGGRGGFRRGRGNRGGRGSFGGRGGKFSRPQYEGEADTQNEQTYSQPQQQYSQYKGGYKKQQDLRVDESSFPALG